MSMQVEIVNRSTMIDQPHAGLRLRPRETAIVTIDMHRGHLDPAVATMAARPQDAKRVIAAAKELLELARGQGPPVIHLKLVYRRIPGHVLGLQNVARCLGWVLSNQEFRDKIEEGARRND